MHRLTGIGVSPGIVVGRAVVLMQSPLGIRFPVAEDRVPGELRRLEEAWESSRRQLVEIRERVACSAGAELAYLFDAQLLMLDDATLNRRVRLLVGEQHVNAEWAVQQAFEELAAVFEEIEDTYLRERKGDLADVSGRLRLNLHGAGAEMFRDVDAASVLIADDLVPSMAAQVDWKKIRGFASDTGSRTHHTSILARSLHVPAVVGLGTASRQVAPGAIVVIDGTAGELIIDPPPELVNRARASAVRAGAAARHHAPPDPAVTTDGVRVGLQANIELPEDVATACEYGAEGIGLFRSEYLLASSDLESLGEEAQYEAYRAVLEAMAPRPVSIRTFDVGVERSAPARHGWRIDGDAAPPGPGGPLGLRAIRLSLARREVFKTQLRALLRASCHGRLRVTFPFVSGIDELREARAVLRESLAELRSEGRAPGPEPPVGVMIEIPSAAVTSDLLAREAAFFSVGTNDLTQYALAVDRSDAGVSALFEPLHPAILRMLRMVIRAAGLGGIPVSLCGEMASDPAIIPLLLGLGLTDLSMNPAAIPAARGVIRKTSASGARRLAARIMRLATAGEIGQCLSRDAAHAGVGARQRKGGTSAD